MRNVDFTKQRIRRLLRISAVVAVFVAALVIQWSMITEPAAPGQAPQLWRATAMQQVLGPDLQMRLSLFLKQLQQNRNVEFIRPLKPSTLYADALAAYEGMILARKQDNPYALYRAGVMYGLDGFPGHAQDMLVRAAQKDSENGAMYLAVARLFTADASDGSDLRGVLKHLRNQPRWLQDLTLPHYYRTIGDPAATTHAAMRASEHQIAFGMWLMLLATVGAVLLLIGIGIVVRFLFFGIFERAEKQGHSRAVTPISVPWSLLDALEALAILTILVISLGAGGQALSRHLSKTTDDPALQAGIMAVQYTLSVGLALWVAMSKTRAGRRLSAMGLRTSGRPAQMVSAGVAGYSVLLIGGMLLSLALESFSGITPLQVGLELMGEHTAVSILIYLLLLAVVAPLAEELLFRGYLYPALREKMSKFAAVGISAILFALLHMNPVATVPIIVIGIVLAMLYETTRSVIPCAVCHAMNNLLVFCVLMLAQY